MYFVISFINIKALWQLFKSVLFLIPIIVNLKLLF